MSVDALELAFERDYVSTFVICTGDSDFTPLVHKLRELNKRVIGVGVEDSTSALLPPACDEFLFYDRSRASRSRRRPKRQRTAAQAAREPEQRGAGAGGRRPGPAKPQNADDLAVLVAQTLAGLQRSSSGAVLASSLKRALLRKDPTFSEADYGFRAFGELLRHLAERNVVELTEGSAKGDPEVSLPPTATRRTRSTLLRNVVADLSRAAAAPALGAEEPAPQGAARTSARRSSATAASSSSEGGGDAGVRGSRVG